MSYPVPPRGGEPNLTAKEKVTMKQERTKTPPSPEGTAPSLGGTLETIGEGVKDSVKTVNDALTETASNVGEAAHDTASKIGESIHDTMTSMQGLFDFSGFVRQHPWALLAGCMAVGFLLSGILSGRRDR
jgi:ElaB/YqjD/DUF883 family membrane-anchored ribosome-binding protein